MSRIEKALEKAAQLRSVPAEVKQVTTQAVPARTSQPASRFIELNPENGLLATITDPHSPVSEQYRKLKANIVKLTKGAEFRNILMVTSTISREGKSLTSLNLAISLAQEHDHTVLLIDADLRRPSIHQYLEFEPTIGLSECLVNGNDIGEAIIRTGIGSLSVIPAGKEVPNPLELFSSRKMQDMISEIKNRYHDRYVIIDTPPLLPFAETRTLGRLVDGIVLVIKEGDAPKEHVLEAIEAVKGCNILGVVFNQASVSVDDSRYGDYSGYLSYKKAKVSP